MQDLLYGEVGSWIRAERNHLVFDAGSGDVAGADAHQEHGMCETHGIPPKAKLEVDAEVSRWKSLLLSIALVNRYI